jgi:acid phosphatase class B
MTLKTIDLRYLSEYEKNFSNLTLDQYFDYVKTRLSPDFQKFKELQVQFESVLDGNEQNLIPIQKVIAFADCETADKIRFIVNHLSNEVKNNNSTITEDKFGQIKKEMAHLNDITANYVTYRHMHEADLLSYVDYNTYMHRDNEKLCFADYKDKMKKS